jgi:hypothetical protein
MIKVVDRVYYSADHFQFPIKYYIAFDQFQKVGCPNKAILPLQTNRGTIGIREALVFRMEGWKSRLIPSTSIQSEPKMPNLFRKLFWPSSKTKSSNATPYTPPYASRSHAPGDSAVNLNLITRPIIEGYQIGVPSERKQRCIEYGITTLELLKEISEANSALRPLKAVCGVTLAILNTIKVRFGHSFYNYGILTDTFRLWIITKRRGGRYCILFTNIVVYLNSNSTRRMWSK